MRRIISLTLFIGVFCLGYFRPTALNASHAMGTDLSYRCLGGNTYEFTLSFYRDCSGVSAPTSASLRLNSTTCSVSNQTLTLPQVGVGVEVSPLCPSQISNSTCNSGSLPGVQQYIYRGTYTFTQNCPDWNISYSHCCRNTMITNLASPGSQDIYIETTLNNTLSPCNNSPTFTSLPVPYICAGQTFCYNHGAIDVDGDSLVYTLMNAQDGPYPGTNIAYNTPNNATYPITTNSGLVNFDPQTGSMCVTPSGLQVCVVTIRVDEYRNNVQIGSTMRDLQIVVISCSNQQPNMINGGMFNHSGGIRLDSNSVEICPGELLQFDVRFSDPNTSDNVTLATNLAAAIPGASFSTSGNNPVTGRFTWTPSAFDVGFHSFTISVQDDGCPILGSQVFSFDIRVLQGTTAGPDLAYCPAGGPVTLAAAGGSSFTWNTLSGDPGGLSCTSCSSPQASPNVTSTYEVVSNLSSLCKNRDTVVVNRVPDFNLNLSPDDTICRYGSSNLLANAGPGTFAPYTFNWSNSASLSGASISNPIASPQSTSTYVLTATSNVGCTIVDSVTVQVSGVAPRVNITPLDTLCENTSHQISALVSWDCDTTSIPCSGPSNTGTVGAGTASSITYSPHYMYTTSAYSMRKQFIYTRQELEAMGFTGGGKITSLAMNYSSVGSQATGLRIRMGCTTQDQWANSPYNFITGLSEVKTAFNYTATIGWNTFVLDFPYYWDGTSNLVVEFCKDNAQTGTGASTYYHCPSPLAYRTLYYHQYNGSGTCSQLTGSRASCRPDMRFTFCEAISASLNYTWAPSNGLSNSTLLNPIININTPGTYTLNVADGNCVGSDHVSVQVAPAFPVDMGNDTSVCKNIPMTLSPTVGGGFGPYTYSWSPSTGLGCDTCATTTATPADSTTYIAAIRSSLGCTMRDTMTINISGVAPLIDLGNNDTVCPGSGGSLLEAIISQDCGITSQPCTGASNTGTIGNGTSASTTYGPHYLYTSAYSQRRQFIFTKAELDAMGFTGGGRINSLSLRYSTANSAAAGIRIKMGCTSQSEFNTAPYSFIPNLDLVKGPFTHTPTVGWNTFTLDHPYNWDGFSNLVVEFCVDNAQTGTSSTVYYSCISPTAYRTLYINQFNLNGACSYATGTRTSCRPDMQFNFCRSLPAGMNYSWTPSTGLSSTNTGLTTASPSQTTLYTLTVDDGTGCVNSDNVVVAIDSTVYVDATTSHLSPCIGQQVQLNANVTGSPMPGRLNSCGTNNTPCVMPPYSRVVGSGTASTSTYVPFFGTYKDVHYQFLYRASDLQASGLSSGIIRQIGWNITSKSSTNRFRQFTIRMGCTNATELNTSTGWLPTQLVWGAANYTTTTGWNNFNLNNPFDWDGTSNIVIEVCFNSTNNGTSPGGSDAGLYRSGIGYYGTMRAYSNTNGTNGCTMGPSFRYTAVPIMNFEICPPAPPAFTYSWSPSTGLSNPNVANPSMTFNGGIHTYSVTISGGQCTVTDSVLITECGLLPADQLSLYGEKEGQQGLLRWVTRNEQNTSHFILQRSPDGIDFENLGQLSAAGTHDGSLTYAFTDSRPLPGENLYRVMLVDLDGTLSYSNSVSLHFSGLDGLLRMYPNPTQSGRGISLDFQSETGGKLNMVLTDMLGRTVKSNVATLNQGLNVITYNTEGLSAGTYFLYLRSGGFEVTRKVTITE